MLARETEQAFDDKDWIYEIKWDGYRAIAEVNHSNILLYSRSGNTFNHSYPVIVEALKKQNINAIIDGEIVVLNENGEPSFQLLQHYESEPDYQIVYYVFDVLSINGTNTCDLTLIERKQLLKKLLKNNETIRYADYIKETGVDFFEVAKSRNLEGIMAKKANSLYHVGIRTKEWLKIKHHHSQEAIIAGFTEPTGARKYFGALVLGIRDGNKLKYVGHTGSGFDYEGLKKIYTLLKPLIQNKSPFKENVKTNMPVTWVKPVLVCEIKYTEFTHDGHMRHPIFLRLRNDKKPNEVTMDANKKVIKKTTKPEIAAKSKKGSDSLVVGKTTVNITNTQKIFWPEEEITKGDVINYYQAIAGYILPYLKGRPQSLLRHPNGISKPAFFHKDAGDEAPEWVKTISLFSESANKDINYIICDNKATLAYMNNLGCIEINPWHSTIKTLDKPDYLIIDLDPSPKNTFEQVIETANVVKSVLDRAGAQSFCKTSGATGLHVYIPMQKKYTYDQVKSFAELICILTNEQLPKITSVERNLKKRGNKIYLDHLQNRKGQTIASVYSLRPKAGATVSTPLLWKEVKTGLSPSEFTIHTIFKRLKTKGDLFTGILGKGIDLMKCVEKLENK